MKWRMSLFVSPLRIKRDYRIFSRPTIIMIVGFFYCFKTFNKKKRAYSSLYSLATHQYYYCRPQRPKRYLGMYYNITLYWLFCKTLFYKQKPIDNSLWVSRVVTDVAFLLPDLNVRNVLYLLTGSIVRKSKNTIYIWIH